MKRWTKTDTVHDCPYTCGYNVGGTTRFADRDFVRALLDPAFAEHLLGQAIDTGLSPEDTLQCCLWHEEVEKVILDADNPIDLYPDAHEMATAAEHELVKKKGGIPHRYETGLERIIRYCMRKPLKVVARDYACAPALDDPDANDRRILRDLRRLGVIDSFKVSKKSVDYGSATNNDHCAACTMWQGGRGQMLALCDLVDGTVRDSHVCNEFKEGEHEQVSQAPGGNAPQSEEAEREPETVH